jgi:hypothetical protein
MVFAPLKVTSLPILIIAFTLHKMKLLSCTIKVPQLRYTQRIFMTAQSELNEVLSNSVQSLLQKTSIQENLINALLFVLSGKDQSIKDDLIQNLSGLAQWQDERGNDSSAALGALETVSRTC